MTPTRLYRGVALAIHDAGRGLTPRGTNPECNIPWGHPGIVYGMGGIAYGGRGGRTGATMHQLRQRSYADSAFLSTTPHFERAKEYALHRADEGVVYEIDPSTFQQFGILAYAVNDIVVMAEGLGEPRDEEHALLCDPPGPFPWGIVVEKHRVSRTG